MEFHEDNPEIELGRLEENDDGTALHTVMSTLRSAVSQAEEQLETERIRRLQRMREFRQAETRKLEEKFEVELLEKAKQTTKIAKLTASLRQATADTKKYLKEKRRAQEERQIMEGEMMRLRESAEISQRNFLAAEAESLKWKTECDAQTQQRQTLQVKLDGEIETTAQQTRDLGRLELKLHRCSEELESSQRVIAMTQQRQQEEQGKHGGGDVTPVDVEPDPDRRARVPVRRDSETSSTEHHHHQLLRRVYVYLSNNISAHQIAAKMYQRCALTLKELESIQTKRETKVLAAEELINILLHQPYEVYQYFLKALKQTTRRDVYNWLLNNALPEDTPCTDCARLIRENYVFLIENMDSKYTMLLDNLHNNDVLDSYELNELMVTKSMYDRNEKLLAVITRKSSQQFDDFLKALDATSQHHISVTLSASREASKNGNAETVHWCDSVKKRTSDIPCRTRSRVVAVCKLHDKVYVARWVTDTISVYSAGNPHVSVSLPYILASGLRDPWSMATCHNGLYIADVTSRCVWKMDPVDGKLEKWLRNVDDIVKISASSDDNLIVLQRTIFNAPVCRSSGRRTFGGRLTVYNGASRRLSDTSLPKSITSPQSVVGTNGGTSSFIVSHGEMRTDLHRVCEVNAAGEILVSFGRSPGNAAGQLNWPIDVVLDGEERVIVADSGNSRILLLNRQLTAQLRVLVCVLHATWCPFRLFYDEHSRLLIVGYDDSVEIYSENNNS